MERFNKLVDSDKLEILEKGFFIYDNYPNLKIDDIKLYVDSQIKTGLNDMTLELNKLITINNKLKNEKDVLNSMVSKKDNKISNKIEELIDTIRPKNCFESGEYGELWLLEYINDHINDTIITRTNYIKGCGDLLVEYSGVKYYIESKNHDKYINTDQVKDFINKAITEFNNNECGIAIFVAQRAKRIAAKKIFEIESINTNKGRLYLIYICDVFNYPKFITVALNIGKIIQMHTNNNDGISLDKIQKMSFNIDTLLKSIRSQKKLVNGLIEIIKKDENICMQLLEDCKYVLSEGEHDLTEKSFENKLLSIYTKILIEEKGVSSSSYKREYTKCGISERDVNKFNLRLRSIEKIYKLKLK